MADASNVSGSSEPTWKASPGMFQVLHAGQEDADFWSEHFALNLKSYADLLCTQSDDDETGGNGLTFLHCATPVCGQVTRFRSLSLCF